jgi:dienelactone hydrolase
MVKLRERWYLNILLLIAAAALFSGCQLMRPPAASAPDTPGTAAATMQAAGENAPETAGTPAAIQPTNTAAATATILPTETSLPTATFTPSPTADPYAGLSMDSLAMRSYGGGEVMVEEVLAVNSYFTRTLVSYPSDGLKIYGFMNVPKRGTPPFPVVIALHGYIDPQIYQTLDYTTRYADALARDGFLVIHPNLRGYPPSDEGDNLFRVGMAVDVLNLIEVLKAQAGREGALAQADANALGIWGHSMGGGVSLRVITTHPDVRAAVLYGAMSGDDRRNHERIFDYFSNGTRGLEELGYPPEAFLAISPVYYLDRIQAQVSIHHGNRDPDVPPAWSKELCQMLADLNKQVECFFYPDEAHTFNGEGDELFMRRAADFFSRALKP